jgi:hypothetical protein
MAENLSVDAAKIRAGLRIVRRRRWFLWLVILVYMPAMWLTLKLSPSFGAIGTAFVVWLIALVVVALISATARCPRCGNYFHMHGMTLMYFRKCLHCQLHISADKKT